MLNILKYFNIVNIKLANICLYYSVIAVFMWIINYKFIIVVLILDIHYYLMSINFKIKQSPPKNTTTDIKQPSKANISMDIQAEGMSREIFDIQNVKREYYEKFYNP
tara:strand:- start:595 stop:915 length:321 start_codon:yes stop_codon:yes gene_type:complete